MLYKLMPFTIFEFMLFSSPLPKCTDFKSLTLAFVQSWVCWRVPVHCFLTSIGLKDQQQTPLCFPTSQTKQTLRRKTQLLMRSEHIPSLHHQILIFPWLPPSLRSQSNCLGHLHPFMPSIFKLCLFVRNTEVIRTSFFD